MATLRQRACGTLLAALWVGGLTPQAEAQQAREGRDNAAGRIAIGCEAQQDPTGCRGGLRQSARNTVFPVESPGPGSRSRAAQQAKQRDSVLNGVLIGAGVGALLGLIPDYYDDCEECHDSLYASIAVGAGVGLLVDFLKGKPAPSPSQSDEAFTFGVAIAPTLVGIGGRVRWR